MTKEKSGNGLTVQDLEAGLTKLQKSATADNPVSRRNELLAKAQTAAGLTADENAELVKSLTSPEAFAQTVTAPLQSDDMVKSVDVSPYLREQHDAMVKSLGILAERLEKSETKDHEFKVALATTMHIQTELMKSYDARLGVIEGQPA